ncbi:hypothetical protein BK635_16310 [Pseudomonas chlororaphis]|nr:hypothetical protein BK635_16310 [Pseudomonas chlororaphis]
MFERPEPVRCHIGNRLYFPAILVFEQMGDPATLLQVEADQVEAELVIGIGTYGACFQFDQALPGIEPGVVTMPMQPELEVVSLAFFDDLDFGLIEPIPGMVNQANLQVSPFQGAAHVVELPIRPKPHLPLIVVVVATPCGVEAGDANLDTAQIDLPGVEVSHGVMQMRQVLCGKDAIVLHSLHVLLELCRQAVKAGADFLCVPHGGFGHGPQVVLLAREDFLAVHIMIARYNEQSLPLQATTGKQLVEEVLGRLVLLSHWTVWRLPKSDIARAEDQLWFGQFAVPELLSQELQ